MRIEQLQVYRQNGITTLAEGALFENAKKRRQEEVGHVASEGVFVSIRIGGCIDFDVVMTNGGKGGGACPAGFLEHLILGFLQGSSLPRPVCVNAHVCMVVQLSAVVGIRYPALVGKKRGAFVAVSLG